MIRTPASICPDRAPLDALYLHIPFCFHKCHYCDFYSIVDQPPRETPPPEVEAPEAKATADPPAGPAHADRQRLFTDALIAELRHHAHQRPLTAETLFVGGGTPTLLRVELWRELLAALRETGVTRRLTEFTVEANPETVTPELLAVLAEGGVNRLSMGAQSFQPHLLKALERWHDPASVGRAVALARAAGITNINLDLIFAIPSQTLAQLDADLEAVLALEPTHLSCYSLIFEPHTPLTQKMKLGRIKPVDESLERAMYERVLERLAAAGFEHYEVSNWARRADGTDMRCRHNMIYWQNGNWLGLGPSAASHIDGRRWKNQPHLGRYTAGSPTPPMLDEEQLGPDASVGEQLMLRLRLREGAALDWLDARVPADHPRQEVIREMLDLELMERTATHLRLTQRGLFVADAIITKLL